MFKTQQPETVWLWISKYNKHGRSLYLKVETLSLSLRSEILVFKDSCLFLKKTSLNIKNSTIGGGMDFDKQVYQNGDAWSIGLQKNGGFEFVFEFVI